MTGQDLCSVFGAGAAFECALGQVTKDTDDRHHSGQRKAISTATPKEPEMSKRGHQQTCGESTRDPSHVFPGLIEGASLCLPNVLPT